ncbi:hypothetical protein MXD81_16760, partial [Microbacteriaceae bacterium K1510]|nr:hypothetical protein [Microbacteriaceae bacterium K1510]
VVLERNNEIGGCIRTEELTLPGFKHDVMATTFVLFTTSPAFAEIGSDLAKHGLEFANTDLPTAVVLPDGRHVTATRNRARNISAFDALAAGDGTRYGRDVAYI